MCIIPGQPALYILKFNCVVYQFVRCRLIGFCVGGCGTLCIVQLVFEKYSISNTSIEELHFNSMSMKSNANDERETFSLDYQFYTKRFRPDLAEIIHYEESFHNEEMKYESLEHSMPEMFDLKNLDNIFVSWFKVLNDDVTKLLPLNSTSTGNIQVIYENDNHTYFSDHYISTYITRGVTNKELCIKLAKNGFIYSKPVVVSDGINVFTTAQPRHCSTAFVYLDVSHASSLKKLKKFAGDYLGTDKLVVKLLYEYHTDHFDFKAYNEDDRSQGVVITFEDLPARDDYFNEDYWLEVDVEDEETTEPASKYS